MSTPWANQREGCLQRTTHDGRAGCMQFLPCYPRISPTVNTVGDKKSVPVTDSPAHQIEACMGAPIRAFCSNGSTPDSRRRRPSAPRRKSWRLDLLYFHYISTVTARARCGTFSTGHRLQKSGYTAWGWGAGRKAVGAGRSSVGPEPLMHE
jgi:hypothetical protein